MKPIVGIFESSNEAQSAAERLSKIKKPNEEIRLLTSEMSQTGLEANIPTEDAETQGIGKAIGGVVGGAIALAAASHLGSYIWGTLAASHSFIGPIVILGGIALTILGTLAGIKVVGLAEEAISVGIPHDDLFLYRDALEQKHSIVIALADSDERAELFRDTLSQMGAESLDAARDRWWIGLRSAEAEHYRESEPGQTGRKVA